VSTKHPHTVEKEFLLLQVAFTITNVSNFVCMAK